MNSYNKILAIVDPETDKQKSLERAIELAEKTGASVTAFLTVYNLSYDMTTRLSVDEREIMRQAVVDDRIEWLSAIVEQRAANTDVALDVKVVWHNRPFESIIVDCITGNYDLIVKGTQEHDALKSVIFTPTDWHLLRKAPVSVLLVKDHDWQKGGQVLAAVNVGTEDEAHRSLNHSISKTALWLGDTLEAQVSMVNSYPGTPVNIAIEIPEFNPQSYNESVKDYHHENMEQHAQTYGVELQHCFVEQGLPEDVIPDVAQRLDAELVIIGTVGRQGISAAFIGNTAEHVIDKLDCDVLALKPEGFEGPIKV